MKNALIPGTINLHDKLKLFLNVGAPSSMTSVGKMKYLEGSYWCTNAEKIANDLEGGKRIGQAESEEVV